MVLMMEEMGIQTGLNIDDVIDTGLMAEEFCGRNLLGHVTRSGPVRHRNFRHLSLQQLRLNGEIAPALLFAGKMKEKHSGEALVAYVIREALAKNWPVPESLKVSAEGVFVKEEFGARDILVTRFKVLEIQKEKNEGILEVLCQKANGDVFMEGQARLTFSR
jgi:hypothetical protein